MVAAPEYSLRTQAKIPLALAALHNFIHVTDPDDEAEHEDDHKGGDHGAQSHEIDPAHLGQYITEAEKQRAGAARDTIVMGMWEDYQGRLAEREEGLESSEGG